MATPMTIADRTTVEPDRQVDAARGDHRRHAERDDRRRRRSCAVTLKRLRGRREGVGEERQGKAGEDRRHEHPEDLACRRPARQGAAVLALRDRVVEWRRRHGAPSSQQPASMAPVMSPVTSSGEVRPAALVGDQAPAPQHGDAVADGEHVGHPVADQDDARCPRSRRRRIRSRTSATWRTEIAAVGSSISTIAARRAACGRWRPPAAARPTSGARGRAAASRT